MLDEFHIGVLQKDYWNEHSDFEPQQPKMLVCSVWVRKTSTYLSAKCWLN